MSKDAQKKYVEIGKSKIDHIEGSGVFEVPSILGPQPDKRRQFFIFRQAGDFIEGFLGRPIANIRRNASYPIETEPDWNTYRLKGTWEIFGNKIDHQIVEDNELIGALVRVEFIGHQHIKGFSRPRKVKRWFKIEGLDLKHKGDSK